MAETCSNLGENLKGRDRFEDQAQLRG